MGIGPALGGFAGGLSAGLSSGQKLVHDYYGNKAEQVQRQGMQAAGKALMSMFGGQPTGQEMQPPAPGQPSTPLGGQPPPPGGMQPQQTMGAMQHPDNQVLAQQMPWFGPQAQTPQGGPPQGAPPQGGPPPQAPQGGPPQGGQPFTGVKNMSWQSIIQGVKAANPDASPEVLIAAVNQFLPIMSAQSQSEWRQAQLSLGQGRLAQGQERVDQSGQRVQQGDRRLDQGDRRANRLEKALDQTISYHQKMLDTAREKITNSKTKEERDFYLKAYKERLTKRNADLQAQVKAATAGGMPAPPELQKKLDDAAAQSDRELQQLQTGQAPAQGGDTGGAPPKVSPDDPVQAVDPTGDPTKQKPGMDPSQKGNPIPEHVMAQYTAGIAKNPGKKGAAIAALKAAGYDTSALEGQ